MSVRGHQMIAHNEFIYIDAFYAGRHLISSSWYNCISFVVFLMTIFVKFSYKIYSGDQWNWNIETNRDIFISKKMPEKNLLICHHCVHIYRKLRDIMENKGYIKKSYSFILLNYCYILNYVDYLYWNLGRRTIRAES